MAGLVVPEGFPPPPQGTHPSLGLNEVYLISFLPSHRASRNENTHPDRHMYMNVYNSIFQKVRKIKMSSN